MSLNAVAQVRRLDISSCSSQLVLESVKAGAAAAPQLRPNSDKDASLFATPLGWRLVCTSASSTRTSSAGQQIHIHGVQFNRAIGANASAVQNIGGQQRGTNSQGKTIHVQAHADVLLYARGWVGSLTAHDGIWQADIELSAGDISFGILRSSYIKVHTGHVDIQEIQGRFDGHLLGAGSIEAASMRSADLNLRLMGAGSMSFMGKAQSARIDASGVGSIVIEHVLTEPVIKASGLTSIDVGR